MPLPPRKNGATTSGAWPQCSVEWMAGQTNYGGGGGSWGRETGAAAPSEPRCTWSERGPAPGAATALAPAPGSIGGVGRASPHAAPDARRPVPPPPERVDVGAVGGEASRHLGALGDGAVPGNHDVDTCGGLVEAVQCLGVRGRLIVLAHVEERDQYVGEHVADEQDATVREEDRGMADGVRLMLDDLARHGSAVRGQRGEEPDQFERDTGRALRRHGLRPLPRFRGDAGRGRGGVARHIAEPAVPEQVVPVRMGAEPGDHRDVQLVHRVGELVQLGAFDAGIDDDQSLVPAHHDGIAPDPLALPDPDAVGHLTQLAHVHSRWSVTVLRPRSVAELIACGPVSRGKGRAAVGIEQESGPCTG